MNGLPSKSGVPVMNDQDRERERERERELEEQQHMRQQEQEIHLRREQELAREAASQRNRDELQQRLPHPRPLGFNSSLPPSYNAREQDRDRDAIEQRNRALLLERAQEQTVQQQQQLDHGQRPQHQNNSGTIPLHQPVASRLTAHSPGGLLAAHGAGGGLPLSGSSGPGNAFAASLLSEANRPQHHGGPVQHQSQVTQHQPFGQSVNSQALLNHVAQQSSQVGTPSVFGPSHNGVVNSVEAAAVRSIQQMPFANNIIQGLPNAAQQQQLGQGGQQPILNDALSYLDQVKVQFSEHPDVYNRFLDIMKDFKSQAIDTPGVINRVSELFAGHPNLIQGFNTFLPPGYRIECGAGNDPNSIRVTTPMGTTVQSITGRANLQEGGPGANYNYPQRVGQASGWDRPAHSVESPETGLSPSNRVQYGGHDLHSHESQQAAATHRQQQQGVHHLQNAVATATGQAPPRHILTPTPGQGYQQPGNEKRGPVEFNHAISYVNKIKNRFHDKPEIYKQFLEILQTYQRESKPIQDVYAQVTSLFSDAMDLLDDFKQFLPESAAHAKQAAVREAENREAALAMISGQTGIASGMNNGLHGTPRIGETARMEPKLPAIGTFAPPGTKIEGLTGQTKKRARNGSSALASHGTVTENGSRGTAGTTNKRTKTNHQDANPSVDIEPTLIPRMPEPMPTISKASEDQRNIAFFDKVKKSIGNKQSFAEFLKLINMFTMDLVDKNVLVHKVSSFIGGNAELMDYFKNLVKYVPGDEIIENVPAQKDNGKVSLSNCRGLGPSYRLLPRREKLKACSGRDEMCNAVLNDEWASHPTWASEDSGFVAHRKNMFEETLHRVEEERHDYDFNIEANAKVIQLLEPIGLQICGMTKEQLQTFRMPHGLGGSSRSIYNRILKKIWGPEEGPRMCENLFNDPTAVLPMVLARLKQKDEEWRLIQREWEKIWHAQTQAVYLKSLDHLGIHVKTTDKKLFSAKFIVENMKSILEGQRRQRGTVLDGQLIFDFSDQAVVLDAIRLAVLYITTNSQHTASETERTASFLKDIVPLFLGITDAAVQDRVKDIVIDSADEEAEEPVPIELSNGRGRRTNGKKDLRRDVLDKSKHGDGKNLHEDSAASASKESTPDLGSGMEDGDEVLDTQEDRSVWDGLPDRWISKDPVPFAADRTTPMLEDDISSANPASHVKREYYSMYCNQTLFVYITLFQTLYKRLKDLKDSESDVLDEINRSKAWKPAKDLGIAITKPDLFRHDGTTYYSQILATIESFVEGTLEEQSYIDFLRHYYLKKGWALYTVMDLLKAICRAAGTCAGNDAKDKTPEIVMKFRQDRQNEAPSYDTEVNYRLSVQKLVKDSDLFSIRYTSHNREARCSIKNADDRSEDHLPEDRMERWKQYVTAWMHFNPTTGIPLTYKNPVLRRNLHAGATDSTSEAVGHEKLCLKLCVNSYKINYVKDTDDLMLKTPVFDRNTDQMAKEERSVEKLERNNSWMKDKSTSSVQAANEDFRRWLDGGSIPNQRSLFPIVEE